MADSTAIAGDRTTRLRPEARPLPFNDLTATQQQAFREVVELLCDAVDVLPSEGREAAPRARQPARRGRPLLDHDRKAQMLFLSGERGTGKSTVLLSLMAAAGADDRDPPSRWDVDDAALGKKVGRLRKQLLWLDPLDLDPLASGTNLLAALLVRLEELVTDSPSWRSGADRDEDSGGDHAGAVSDLRRLQSDVARAWDGNTVARGPNVDTDVFADEVHRTETARLGLAARWGATLDRLARARAFGRFENGGPLLVLPIDDVDLNPFRGLEILRLLRMVTAPRLFTLALGDDQVLEQLFRAEMQGKYRQLAMFAGSDSSTDGESWFKTRVASAAMRKLVPPGQRLYLPGVRASDALKYRPAAEAKTLREQLEKLRAALTLELSDEARARVGPLFDSSRSYTGAGILNGSWREIADLWFVLDGLPAAGAADLREAAFRAMAKLARISVLDDTELATNRAPLLRWLDREDGELTAASERLKWQPADRWLIRTGALGKAVTIVVAASHTWQLEPSLRAEPQTLGYLAVVEDLTAPDERRGVAGDLARWSFCEARWDVGTGAEIVIPWVTPPLRRVWLRDEFLRGWARGVSEIRSRTADPRREMAAELVKVFRTVAQQLTGDPGAADSRDTLAEWDLAAAVLLAPESGTGVTRATRNLVAQHEERLKSFVTRIRLERWRRLKPLYGRERRVGRRRVQAVIAAWGSPKQVLTWLAGELSDAKVEPADFIAGLMEGTPSSASIRLVTTLRPLVERPSPGAKTVDKQQFVEEVIDLALLYVRSLRHPFNTFFDEALQLDFDRAELELVAPRE